MITKTEVEERLRQLDGDAMKQGGDYYEAYNISLLKLLGDILDSIPDEKLKPLEIGMDNLNQLSAHMVEIGWIDELTEVCMTDIAHALRHLASMDELQTMNAKPEKKTK